MDTAKFARAANLDGFQTLLRGCKAQLKDTELNYDDISYGFGWKVSFPLFWASLSMAAKAGMAIGMIVGGFLPLICCICCLGRA